MFTKKRQNGRQGTRERKEDNKMTKTSFKRKRRKDNKMTKTSFKRKKKEEKRKNRKKEKSAPTDMPYLSTTKSL